MQGCLDAARQVIATLLTLRGTFDASERRVGELSTELVGLRSNSEVTVKAHQAKLDAEQGEVLIQAASPAQEISDLKDVTAFTDLGLENVWDLQGCLTAESKKLLVQTQKASHRLLQVMCVKYDIRSLELDLASFKVMKKSSRSQRHPVSV